MFRRKILMVFWIICLSPFLVYWMNTKSTHVDSYFWNRRKITNYAVNELEISGENKTENLLSPVRIGEINATPTGQVELEITTSVSTNGEGALTTTITTTAWNEFTTENSEKQDDEDIISAPENDNVGDLIVVESNNTNELLNSANTQSYKTPYRRRKNVLFLMADDMRPLFGSYIDDEKRKLYTPHFDRLAQQSLVLKKAFVQYSLCGPSRTSLLTGRRPDTVRVFGNRRYWRDTSGNFTTIPQHFKNSGYLTFCAGKIFHPSLLSSNDSDPVSWTETPFSKYIDGGFGDPSRFWDSISETDKGGKFLTDEYAVDYITDKLKTHAEKAKTGEQPIFMALGFRKPHIPLVCPDEYFALYPEETESQYLADLEWQNPRVMFDMVNTTVDAEGRYRIPDAYLRQLRRAYFACISYVDSQLGRIIDAVDQLGLADNTVITFMADHAYHLGENMHWGKRINSEIANHVPMMISIPGRTDQGMESDSLVEALDMFPTVLEAAGLDPIPRCPEPSFMVELCAEGSSFLPLVDDQDIILKDVALSQIYLGNLRMEYTLRTSQYRYIEEADLIQDKNDNGTFTVHVVWRGDAGLMTLYDLESDPLERINLATVPAYAGVKASLSEQLSEKIKPVTIAKPL